jgi:enoyl-CoA hydratase
LAWTTHPAGLSQKLARLVGAQRASYASFTSEWIDAQTALAWGLVATVVEPEAW